MDRRLTRSGRRPYSYSYLQLSTHPEIQEMLKLGLIMIISTFLPAYRSSTQEQFEDILRHTSFQFSVRSQDMEEIELYAQRNRYVGNFYDNINNGIYRRTPTYPSVDQVLDAFGRFIVGPEYTSYNESSTEVEASQPIPDFGESTESNGSQSLNLELGNSQSEISSAKSDNASFEPLEGFLPVVEDEVIDEIVTSENLESFPLLFEPEINDNDVQESLHKDSSDLDESSSTQSNETISSISESGMSIDVCDQITDNQQSTNIDKNSDSDSIMDEVMSDVSNIDDQAQIDEMMEKIDQLEDLRERNIIDDSEYNSRMNDIRNSYSSFGKTRVLSRMLNISKIDDIKASKTYYHNIRNESKLRFKSSLRNLYFVSKIRVGRCPDYRSKVTNFFSKYVKLRLNRFSSTCQNTVRYDFKFEKKSSYIFIDSYGSSIYDMYRLSSLSKDIRSKFRLI